MAQLAITTAILLPTTELITTCVKSWEVTRTMQHETCLRENTLEDNLGVTGSLQWCYEHTSSPLIACFHSDLQIFEQGWDERVLSEFDDPKVGVVGFGGALQLGEDDLYRTPYRLQQLRRIDYRSNTTDAETHGERFTGECDVATLDGFALIVRRTLLDKLKGWNMLFPFHNYDNALCVCAHKLGYRVRLVGINCTHHGGQTATTPNYQLWCKQRYGKTDAQIHEESHVTLYNLGRGVLPYRVREQ